MNLSDMQVDLHIEYLGVAGVVPADHGADAPGVAFQHDSAGDVAMVSIAVGLLDNTRVSDAETLT